MNASRLKKTLLSIVSVLIVFSIVSFPCQINATSIDNLVVENDYEIIGWDNFPVFINSDGTISYDYKNELYCIDLGMENDSNYISKDDVYPIVSARFFNENITYIFSSFVDKISDDSYAIFIKLDIINDSNSSINLPTINNANIIGGPSEIKANSEESIYYAVIIGESNNQSLESYDSHLSSMKAHWAEVISNYYYFAEYSDDMKKLVNSYLKSIIDGKINNTSMNCSDYADDLLIGEQINIDIVKDTCDKYINHLTELSNDLFLVIENGQPSLEKSLYILSELRSCIYICSSLNDNNLSYYQDEYEILSKSIYKVFSSTIDSYDCAWQALNISGSTDNMVFNLNSSTSTKAFYDWYLVESKYGDVNNLLSQYAVDSFKYINDEEVALSSVISLNSDYSISLGRLLTYNITKDINLKIENFLYYKDRKVNISLSLLDDVLSLSLNKPIESNIYIELPIIKDNLTDDSLDYYDYNGYLCLQAGNTELSVKLKSKTILTKAIDDNKANINLEKSIASALNVVTDGCTIPSVEDYTTALINAKQARKADNTEKNKCSENLNKAISRISKVVSTCDYYFSNGESMNLLTNNYTDTIIQPFSISTEGYLSSIKVNGEFSENTYLTISCIKDKIESSIVEMIKGHVSIDGITFELDKLSIDKGDYYLNISSDSVMNVKIASSVSGDLIVNNLENQVTYTDISLVGQYTMVYADRHSLQASYITYSDADITSFTKESQMAFTTALNNARNALCTIVLSESECDELENILVKSFNNLETYASDDLSVEAPVALIVMIALSVVLIAGCAITIFVNEKKKRDSETNVINNIKDNDDNNDNNDDLIS